MNRSSISLARLIALNVPRSWQEAVAVVLEAGDAVKLAGTAVTAEQCFISAAGGLQIHGSGQSQGGPTDALAELLAILLAGQVAPSELRALTEPQTAGADGLDGLLKALAYFERPNRQADIAALATRAMAMDAQAVAADSELARLRAGTPAGATVAHPPASPSTGTRRPFMGRLAVLLLVLMVAAGAVWYLNRPAQSEAVAPASSTGAAATTATTPTGEPAAAPSTVRSLVSAASEALTSVADAGLRAIGLAPSQPAAGTTPTTPSATPPGATASTPRPRASSASAEGPAAGGVSAAPAPGVTAAPAATGIELPVVVADPEEGAMAPEVPPGPFTEADAGVEPPALIYPQLPSERQAAPPAGAPHFELLVNERGEVEQVRLRATDAQVRDRMMVSAAKAWRFRPAMKDGKPVRYRVRVPIPR